MVLRSEKMDNGVRFRPPRGAYRKWKGFSIWGALPIWTRPSVRVLQQVESDLAHAVEHGEAR